VYQQLTWGMVRRYRGRVGISRGYLVVRHGAWNSAPLRFPATPMTSRGKVMRALGAQAAGTPTQASAHASRGAGRSVGHAPNDQAGGICVVRFRSNPGYNLKVRSWFLLILAHWARGTDQMRMMTTMVPKGLALVELYTMATVLRNAKVRNRGPQKRRPVRMMLRT